MAKLQPLSPNFPSSFVIFLQINSVFPEFSSTNRLGKKKKKRNYEESAYEPLEKWFMFPTPLFSLRLPPFHPGPPNTSSRLWICSDMLAWAKKSSKQEGRTPPAPPPPSQRPPEGNHAVSKANQKGMDHFFTPQPLQCFFVTEVTPLPWFQNTG